VSKRMKVFVSVLAAVIMITVGSTVAVMAQDGTQTTTESEKSFLADVADILGVTEETLESAIEQATRELTEERLAQLVENDIITQEQLDELLAWLSERPDMEAMADWMTARPEFLTPQALGRFGICDPGIKMGWQMRLGPVNGLEALVSKLAEILGKTEDEIIAAFEQVKQAYALENREAGVQKALENAVANGRISEEEAAQIQSWWDERPGAVDEAFPGAGICPGNRAGHQLQNRFNMQFRNGNQLQNAFKGGFGHMGGRW